MNGHAMYAAVEQADKNELLERYLPLVKRIAYHLISRLPPNVQVEDLKQAGMIGLLEAAQNYDPTQGASFETYAGIRIRGAMLDEIRRSDWTPRSVHRKARQVADVIRDIENAKGRDARDSEIADAMGMSVDDYHHILQDAACSRLFSVDELNQAGEELPEGGHGSNPYDHLQGDAFRHDLSEAIAGLPERERLVMALYYDEELNLREIGEVLGVSESRVCQIHGQAMVRVRARMQGWTDQEPDEG